MRSLILSTAAVMAVSTGAWLFAGGENCAQSAGTCTGDKTALVSTACDAKSCDEKVAAKADGACSDKAALVSTGGDAKHCDEKVAAKTDGSCCGDMPGKAALVSLEPSEAGQADRAATTPKAIDALKPLAGKWKGENEHGTAVIEFKVTSGGSAVVETMFPGTNHEMTNVYVMDGDNLVVTHYCAAGNAPRMKMARSENGTMAFEFLDATNLPDRNMMHMGGLQITVAGPDQLVEKWTSFQDGKPAQELEIKLDRVK